MSVYDDPSMNPVATSRASPVCGRCEREAKKISSRGNNPEWLRGVPPGALGFVREGDRIVPLCRMHGGMNAPVSLKDGMGEWIAQDVLES